jgi:hypothetical protein
MKPSFWRKREWERQGVYLPEVLQAVVPSCVPSHSTETEMFFNPNPGGFVANMTSKTQNCYDKFIVPKKTWKKFCNPPSVLCLTCISKFFYQNDVLFDYSIKMSRFMPILGFCAGVFRAACS